MDSKIKTPNAFKINNNEFNIDYWPIKCEFWTRLSKFLKVIKGCLKAFLQNNTGVSVFLIILKWQGSNCDISWDVTEF